MQREGLTNEFLTGLKERCAYNSNNCGGCETCSQVFGKPEMYDYELVYDLASEILRLRSVGSVKDTPQTLRET